MSRGHAACGSLTTEVGISDGQIAQYWNSHGSAGACPIAVAIALAESSGNCGATHHNSDTHSTTDRGLWQINDYWHPECSDSCAYDCNCNAGCAASVSSGGSNWSPWSTYKTGAYQSYMSRGHAACGTLESSVGISDAAIAQAWNAHGSASACPIAVAVALAESSGNCGAVHHNSDSHSTTDRGLWQINDYWHPECSDSCAYDCNCNAGCAA